MASMFGWSGSRPNYTVSGTQSLPGREKVETGDEKNPGSCRIVLGWEQAAQATQLREMEVTNLLAQPPCLRAP